MLIVSAHGFYSIAGVIFIQLDLNYNAHADMHILYDRGTKVAYMIHARLAVSLPVLSPCSTH